MTRYDSYITEAYDTRIWTRVDLSSRHRTIEAKYSSLELNCFKIVWFHTRRAWQEGNSCRGHQSRDGAWPSWLRSSWLGHRPASAPGDPSLRAQSSSCCSSVPWSASWGRWPENWGLLSAQNHERDLTTLKSGSWVTPGQRSSVGVLRTRKILKSWSISESP